MSDTGRVDDGAIAEALGHAGFELVPLRDGRYAIKCACGYRSAGRQTVVLAIQAGQHHLRKAVAEFRRSGVSLDAVRAR